MLEYKEKLAKKISYDSSERNLKDVYYIVLHYTGVNGDTAKNEADFFAESNERTAGAHWFADRNGSVYKSVRLVHSAWSVGGLYSTSKGAGSLYKKALNKNSVSIEMCDIAKKFPSDKQIKAVAEIINYTIKKCPNVKKIVRHWDVNGKDCPATMTGKNSMKWKKLKKKLVKFGVDEDLF